jgi:hypothetical protein
MHFKNTSLDHVCVVDYANPQNVEFAAGFVDSQHLHGSVCSQLSAISFILLDISRLLRDTERKISTEFRFIGSCVKIKRFY